MVFYLNNHDRPVYLCIGNTRFHNENTNHVSYPYISLAAYRNTTHVFDGLFYMNILEKGPVDQSVSFAKPTRNRPSSGNVHTNENLS